MAANAEGETDRTFFVPEGVSIESMPVMFRNLNNVTIDIQGDIIASSLWKLWPIEQNKQYVHFMRFIDCDGLTFQSNSKRTGKIDG